MKEFGLIEPKSSDLTYNSYLQVEKLLSTQTCKSDPAVHDEMLFIIIHQVYELWFKQILHEVTKLEEAFEKNHTLMAIKVLRRILRIQNILNAQIEVLETMTPNEFNYFRSLLNPASGFQSFQFRALEFKLGLKNTSYLKFYTNEPHLQKVLDAYIEAPCLYDVFLNFMTKRGFNLPQEILRRDVSKAYEPHVEIEKEFAKVYQDPVKHSEEYEILELLLDLDQKLSIWRFRHVQMVERIIGITMGTGGSMGVDYLKSTLAKRAFPEIWSCRKWIIQDLGKR